MKTCTHCNKELPIEAFSKSKRTLDGYRPRCKQCNVITAKISNQKRKEHIQTLEALK